MVYNIKPLFGLISDPKSSLSEELAAEEKEAAEEQKREDKEKKTLFTVVWFVTLDCE